jgi:hypothetical protein
MPSPHHCADGTLDGESGRALLSLGINRRRAKQVDTLPLGIYNSLETPVPQIENVLNSLQPGTEMTLGLGP